MPDGIRDINLLEKDAENSVKMTHTIYLFPDNFEEEKKAFEEKNPTKKRKQRTKSALKNVLPTWDEYTKQIAEEDEEEQDEDREKNDKKKNTINYQPTKDLFNDLMTQAQTISDPRRARELLETMNRLLEQLQD